MSRELLTELVSRYSPSEQEEDAVNYLVQWMGENGFETQIDDAGNAVGVRGPNDAPRTLMLLGHIDTVQGKIRVRVEDDKLYGRGSVDAKGSLCTFASAAAVANIPPNWRVVVIGAVEEETRTSKGARQVRASFNPHLCIIGEPSQASRITLGYKGRLIVEYQLTRPVNHSARPEPSVAALGAAFWEKINAWADQENEGVTRYFDQVQANLRRINTQGDSFNDMVHLEMGFRLPPRFPPNDVIAIVAQFAEPDSELNFYGKEPAYLSDKNNPLVRGMLAAIRARGERPGFVLKTGTSDMNIVGTKWRCPMIAYGPGDSNLDHTPNEHLPLAEYDAAVQTLVHFIENLNVYYTR